MNLSDFLLYMFFSVLESSAIFYMMFKVFKIDIFPVQIIFASVTMSFISFVLRTVYQLPNIDILAQMLLTIAYVWLMFKIHYFYSIILTQMSSLTYFMIQTSYYLIMRFFFGLFSLNDLPFALSISTYALQTISASTALFIGWIVAKKRKGFDFVPDKPNGRLTIRYKDKVLFVLSIISSLIILLTFFFTSYLNGFIFFMPFIYAIILAGYLLYSYKKDRGEDEHTSTSNSQSNQTGRS